MFNRLIIVFMLSALAFPQPSLADRFKGSYETMLGPGAIGPYGVGSGGTDYGVGTTMGRPERIGRSTMIGSSSAQTESATVESMPVFSFRPPSFSAQLPLTPPLPALKQVDMFSESMLRNPALTPSAVTLARPQGPNAAETELPSPFSTEMQLNRHRRARGGGLGQQLLNPLEGL